MRRPFGLPLLALAILGGCDSTAAPNSRNAGTWSTPPIPSGGATVFSLDTAGPRVRGEGEEYGLMGRAQGAFTITGHQAYPAITLTLSYGSGRTATYSASFQTPDQLLGTWTVPGQPPVDSLVFLRQ
jgi:hypothetical protein